MKLDTVKVIGASVLTLITAAIAVWWLFLAADRLGVKAVVENDAVTLDEWARTKDILTIVLPLFTASLAYWVGAQGKSEAKQEAAGAQEQVKAILATSPPDALANAKQQYPEAFTGN